VEVAIRRSIGMVSRQDMEKAVQIEAAPKAPQV
jgi:hypothetical protein